MGWVLVRNDSGLYSNAAIFLKLICFVSVTRVIILISARVSSWGIGLSRSSKYGSGGVSKEGVNVWRLTMATCYV